jgi:hypothetical protein
VARLGDDEEVLAILANDVPLLYHGLLEGQTGGEAGEGKVSKTQRVLGEVLGLSDAPNVQQLTKLVLQSFPHPSRLDKALNLTLQVIPAEE